MIDLRRWFRRATLAWTAAVIAASLALARPAATQETTAEQLKELQELRREVERKRAELRRELQLLHEVVGTQPQGETVGGMSADELAAELRILREDIDRLREQMAGEQLSAQERGFDVTGSVRTRLEWSDLDFTSGAADVAELMRTRVLITGRPRHDTRIVVELQDGREWGEESGTGDADADQFDAHQAYAELQEIYGRRLRLRLGRQELNYGSYRVMGPGAWSNTGHTYDALVLRVGESTWADLLAAKLAERGQRDRNLLGLQAQVVLSEGHFAEPFVLVEQDKRGGADRLLRITTGNRFQGWVTGGTGHTFGYDLEGAAKVGEVGGDDARAWMAAAAVRYRGPSSTAPEVRLGADYLSGDADPADGKLEAYDNPFSSRHEFYGLMDLFRLFPADTGSGGLVDVNLVGEMSAAPTVRVGLHVHHFALAKVAAGSKNLGEEADAVVAYDFNEATAFQWGGSVFVPSDAMKAARGGEDPAFKTWLQLVGRF